MLTATVPLDGGALPDLLSGAELAHLLDTANAGAALPCRAHDPDLWFAESPADLEEAKRLCEGCPIKAALEQDRAERERAERDTAA